MKEFSCMIAVVQDMGRDPDLANFSRLRPTRTKGVIKKPVEALNGLQTGILTEGCKTSF